MKEITVTVHGETGTGKSAIVAVINRALKKEGLKVTIDDNGLAAEILEEDRLRVALRSARPAVKLVETNVARPAKPAKRKGFV